jgi:hypothetical protein
MKKKLPSNDLRSPIYQNCKWKDCEDGVQGNSEISRNVALEVLSTLVSLTAKKK